MDEPGASLREILARQQENMAGAAIISLAWAACYSIFKRLAWKEAFMAAGAGALFSATTWLFLAAYIHAALFVLFPVAVGCGVAAFPIMRGYTKRDERIVDDALDDTENFLRKWVKKFTGGT